MKQITIIIVIIFTLLLTSCDLTDKYGKCRVNYSIVYPDTTIVYDSVFTYVFVTEKSNTHTPYTSSYKGSNYIRLGYNEFVRTTCPIRINSYKTIEKRLKD